MYLSPKKHILSNSILLAAIIRVAGFGISGLLRLIIRRGGFSPDMADSTVNNAQTVISYLIIAATAAVFIISIRRVRGYMELIPKEDRNELARLQEDTFGKKNSALPAELVYKLMELWFMVFVGIQLMYEAFSEIYRHFILTFSDVVSHKSGIAGESYVALYNLSHGFKYQGMFIALLLGIFTTAIFLEDRTLKLLTLLAAAVFLLSSTGMDMASFSVLGQSVGIVWSSLIFHLVDTIGIVVFAFYLRKVYQGV